MCSARLCYYTDIASEGYSWLTDKYVQSVDVGSFCYSSRKQGTELEVCVRMETAPAQELSNYCKVMVAG